MSNEQLNEKQQKQLAALQIEHNLENLFFEKTGFTPNIISPGQSPFAVFYPKNKTEYLTILNALPPTEELFNLTFAGKDSIQTFSPYSIHYGGTHSTPKYMEVVVKYKHEVCPIWIKMPADVAEEKFNVVSFDGEHLGFGRYERRYTYHAKKATDIQEYYGKNKTMYAANENQAEELKSIIFE